MADTYAGPAAIPRGSRVVLLVSQGPDPAPASGYVPVPGVVGRSQGDALAQLQVAGLRARVFNDLSTSRPKGDVIGQMPRANASAPRGSEVVLLVSSGRADSQQGLVALPDAIGAAEADAVQKLRSAGLNPEVAYEYSPTVPAGIVIDQLPNSADVAAPNKRSPWPWVALALALIAVAVAALFLLSGGEKVIVPDVVGTEQADAVAKLEEAGFEVEVEEAEEPGDAEEGQVVSQDPEAGSEAAKGSTVTIAVVGAPEPVEVPDVIGLTEKAATTALEQVGLRANPSTKEDASVTAGTVVAQSPEGGTEVAAGSRVDITVAIAPAPSQSTVPNVIGMAQADAEAALTAVGLEVLIVENASDSVAEGLVIVQLPTPGTIVARGAEVAIAVSTGDPGGAELTTVPDVGGMTLDEAEQALSDAGLNMAPVPVSGTSEPVGKVFAQAPVSGDMIPADSAVIVLYAE